MQLVFIGPGKAVENSYIESYMDPPGRKPFFEMSGTRLQSYLRPVLGVQIDTLTMMDFRASHAADRSSGLSGHDSKFRVFKRQYNRFPLIIAQCTYATLARIVPLPGLGQAQFCGPRYSNRRRRAGTRNCAM